MLQELTLITISSSGPLQMSELDQAYTRAIGLEPLQKISCEQLNTVRATTLFKTSALGIQEKLVKSLEVACLTPRLVKTELYHDSDTKLVYLIRQHRKGTIGYNVILDLIAFNRTAAGELAFLDIQRFSTKVGEAGASAGLAFANALLSDSSSNSSKVEAQLEVLLKVFPLSLVVGSSAR